MQLTASASASVPRRSGLHIGLWFAQGALALAFLASGAMKVSMPMEALQAQMPWVSGSLGGLVRFIGTVEVLGAIGVILPAATRIKPVLTPLAALGLATVMLLASLTHLSRGELGLVPVNLTLGGIALFVAWGRYRAVPIAGR